MSLCFLLFNNNRLKKHLFIYNSDEAAFKIVISFESVNYKLTTSGKLMQVDMTLIIRSRL